MQKYAICEEEFGHKIIENKSKMSLKYYKYRSNGRSPSHERLLSPHRRRLVEYEEFRSSPCRSRPCRCSAKRCTLACSPKSRRHSRPSKSSIRRHSPSPKGTSSKRKSPYRRFSSDKTYRNSHIRASSSSPSPARSSCKRSRKDITDDDGSETTDKNESLRNTFYCSKKIEFCEMSKLLPQKEDECRIDERKLDKVQINYCEEREKEKIPTEEQCLDLSKTDFYCKLCDAHMNNRNMWEAHVRGKRHLKNAKKIPGETISQVRSYKAAPNVRSVLEQLIHKYAANKIIVGLDFIKETQGPIGELYNCFLCGACCTNFDIIQHLLLAKHKKKYLKQLADNGKIDRHYRKPNDGCQRMLELYGRGKVEVYLSK